MGRVATPESRRPVDVDEAVHVTQTVLRATPVFALGARGARTARLEHLDRDPVASSDAPTPSRSWTDLFEYAHGFVTGHELESAVELAGVLLVIGAAQPAGLDPQQRVVGADLG